VLIHSIKDVQGKAFVILIKRVAENDVNPMFHLAIIKKPLQKIEGALMSAVWTAGSV
jgi:hypothetical protein